MLFYLARDKKNRGTLSPVDGTRLADLGWKEKDLENLVAEHIDRVVRASQLFVLAQERAYQEEPDILALDRDGCLYIFELKRWESKQEDLLQVLRYGQKYGQYDYKALNYLFQSYMQGGGKTAPGPARELDEAHRQYFELEKPLDHEGFNREQSFIVMTNGLDRGTREALAYWSKRGVPVRPLVYRVYALKGQDVLFELEPYGPEGDVVEDAQQGLAVVNTCATYLPAAWMDMLKSGKASAYEGRRWAVDRVTKGTPIALYHNGVGIVALGKTTGDVRRAPSGAEPDGEHFLPCEFEYVVDPETNPERAVSAFDINQHLEASHRFRQTVYTLPREAIGFIREELKKRGATKKL